MKFNDFIIELDSAGWEGVHDAQHQNIEKLHRMLFPIIAELEDDIVFLTENN